jgi:hypothetical protein
MIFIAKHQLTMAFITKHQLSMIFMVKHQLTVAFITKQQLPMTFTTQYYLSKTFITKASAVHDIHYKELTAKTATHVIRHCHILAISIRHTRS